MTNFERNIKDKKLLKMFGIDKEEVEKLKEMYEQDKASKKETQDLWLRIDKKLPKIYIPAEKAVDIIKSINKNSNEWEPKTDNFRYREGYIIVDLSPFINIKLPEEDDVLYMINKAGSEVLDEINHKKNIILRDWSNITLHFVIEEEFSNLYCHSSSGERISALQYRFKRDISKKNRDENISVSPEEVNWEIELDYSDKDKSYAIGIKDAEDKGTEMMMILAVLFAEISEMVLDDKYLVTRENLNEVIPKNSNENIHLNREIKQSLKKDTTPIYYIK